MIVINNWKELNVNIKSRNINIYCMKIKIIFKNQENLCYYIQRGEQNVFFYLSNPSAWNYLPNKTLGY